MKKETYVFCVDSDGCAMDTMTYKHQLFFGPLAADVFQIKERDKFLDEWDRINLFSTTRGVNRFVGLVMALEFIGVKEIDNLKKWVETTKSLSNSSLEKALLFLPTDDLKKALEWSNKVNQAIKSYDVIPKAFDGTRESLKTMHELGKVFVVSSANREAVEAEWIEQGLLEFVDELYCQDRGKKEDIIFQLIQEGYESTRIMMIGDSPGDLKAADKNEVSFFPILVGHESTSWDELKNKVVEKFKSNMFTQSEQDKMKKIFWKNLS